MTGAALAFNPYREPRPTAMAIAATTKASEHPFGSVSTVSR